MKSLKAIIFNFIFQKNGISITKVRKILNIIFLFFGIMMLAYRLRACKSCCKKGWFISSAISLPQLFAPENKFVFALFNISDIFPILFDH